MIVHQHSHAPPKQTSALRIGVLDSGMGGLSVLHHIHRLQPAATLDYVADTAYLPYGDKPAALIEQRVAHIADVLCQRGADALVVACNTATAAAVHLLRRRYDLPVVGLEPGVKPAVAATRSGVIGVLATAGTLRSDKYARLLARHGSGTRVIPRACHGWAELVEQGDLQGATARRLVTEQVAPLLAEGADTLVLGCTHYPFLAPVIADLAGPEVTLIDTGRPVARQLQRLLPTARSKVAADVHFLISGALPPAKAAVRRLWGRAASIASLPR